MGTPDLSPYKDMLEKFQERRQELLAESDRLHAPGLPLKFLRQQAHFTTPASNYDMALKAVEKGSSATAKILEKFHISLAELSETLEVPVSTLEEELERDFRSPLRYSRSARR